MNSRNVWDLFEAYNKKYFWSKLNKVKLSWSSRMTLCAGKTAYKVWRRGGTSCCIRLSQPLLSQRPHSDTVDTLLVSIASTRFPSESSFFDCETQTYHFIPEPCTTVGTQWNLKTKDEEKKSAENKHEMIHAYLHVTQGLNYRDSHGPEFRSHMKRINTLEGSKITVFHTFEKEVNKYRIHVYRCDGPCIRRRPYFGILRRAIERPPGQVDKWWSKHQAECGGTFHKIEGPGATNPQNVGNCSSKINYKRNCDPLSGGSRKNHNEDSPREFGTPQKLKGIHDVSDEDKVLQRIRDRYSNVKQTIMLSKEDSKKLSDNLYRYPAPFGNYVQGNVDYNYQGHSPRKIRIRKYLYRHQKASRTFEIPQCSKQNSTSDSRSRDPIDSTDSRKPNVTLLNSPDRLSFNYNYRSRTPDKIKLDKYIGRYREATYSKFNVHYQKISTMKNEMPLNKEMVSISSASSISCPICSQKFPAEDFKKHLEDCFGCDDFDMNFADDKDVLEENFEFTPPKRSVKEVTRNNRNDMSATETCPNCGCLVFMDEMRIHQQYCLDSDEETDLDESPEKLTPDSKDQSKLTIGGSADCDYVSCPSCMERVKEKDIHNHLDECLMFFSEEMYDGD